MLALDTKTPLPNRHRELVADMIPGGGSGRFTVDDSTDEALMRRVAEARDEAALSELYDRYAAVILGSGRRLLGDRSSAEDLLQDVFFFVWKNAASFDPAKASFATWMHRITRNRATDLHRRRASRVKTVAESPGAEPREEDPTAQLSCSFDVTAAFSKLSPNHREILTLSYFQGLSQREISTLIDIPPGTVKSRTTAALRDLHARMARPDEGASNE